MSSLDSSYYANKTILVTGGTGYIGRNIVERLLENTNAEIILFDRTMKCQWASSRITYIQGDIQTELSRLEGIPFDICFHEAANVDTTCTDRENMINTNYYAFLALIALCERQKARLVYASSAAVYGNSACPNVVGQKEEPLNVYGESKLLMDNYVREHTFGIPVIGLRYFNVYGAGEEHKGRMMSMMGQMRNHMRANTDVQLFEFGEQKRDFVQVADIVQCNLLAGQSGKTGIYNCGTGTPVDFNTIFKEYQTHYPFSDTSVKFIKNEYAFFQNETCADIAPTTAALGYTPMYTYVTGIGNYV